MSGLSYCIALCICMVVNLSHAAPKDTTNNMVPKDEQCPPYNYCDGERLPMEMTLDDHTIKCDSVPDPKDKCCLEYGKHFVCYNIMVNGQLLNYDPDNPLRSTDFTGLCRAIAEKRGEKMGRFSSASRVSGGGNKAWRYGKFADVQASNKHIRDLACKID